MTVFRRYLRLRDGFRAAFWQGLWRKDDGTPSDNTRVVMNELREFCRAEASCVQFGKDGRVDTHLTAVIEGRREVWLRIVALLNLTDEQLFKLQGDQDD